MTQQNQNPQKQDVWSVTPEKRDHMAESQLTAHPHWSGGVMEVHWPLKPRAGPAGCLLHQVQTSPDHPVPRHDGVLQRPAAGTTSPAWRRKVKCAWTSVNVPKLLILIKQLVVLGLNSLNKHLCKYNINLVDKNAGGMEHVRQWRQSLKTKKQDFYSPAEALQAQRTWGAARIVQMQQMQHEPPLTLIWLETNPLKTKKKKNTQLQRGGDPLEDVSIFLPPREVWQNTRRWGEVRLRDSDRQQTPVTGRRLRQDLPVRATADVSVRGGPWTAHDAFTRFPPIFFQRSRDSYLGCSH